ncbi:MAG: hypothetical protein MJ001_08955, partial [Paludibacteraceae bacterium]|nr:hypothetical protein [Paludibacteraceae bacterium]
RLLCGRREQCGHCDRLTNQQDAKRNFKNTKKYNCYVYYSVILNGEFIEITLIDFACAYLGKDVAHANHRRTSNQSDCGIIPFY